MVLAGRDGCTTSTLPETVAMEIGAKSRSGLYGSFELRCGATARAAIVARRIVYPSGVALATTSAAILSPAPARVSPMMGRPGHSPSFPCLEPGNGAGPP